MATPSRLNIVCIDNSEFSHNGFEWYVNNHHRPNDVIGLTHVHEMPSLPAIGVMGPAPGVAEVYQSQVEYSYRISKGIKEKYEKLCKEKEMKFETFMLEGEHKPAHMICKLAEEKNAASITMGQRGLGTISRALLGSTSDYVLHHSHVPVMVVPTVKKQ